jgi:predicted transcriptional regulator
MREGQERLNRIADDLSRGEEPIAVTVREFLSWFGAQRRSYWNVYFIRSALKNSNLQTNPDFQSAYVDSDITFSLVPEESAHSETGYETAGSEEEPVEVSPETCVTEMTESGLTAYADPTYRISKLAAANKIPVSVSPDAGIQEAVTLMLTNDFSQLPVMTSDREVKGVISWTSIGTRLALSKNGPQAKDLMDAHQEIRSSASMFRAIPIIIQHQYVLIRGGDNRITGIVTASDLSLQFLQLAEPFLLLGEIENHIRRILASKFSSAELAEAKDPSDPDRKVNEVSDLTFGEYIRLLEHPERWTKLNLPIDRKTLIKQIDRVREVRNDVMHFDPDPLPPDDLSFLRDLVEFFQRLQQLGVT